MNKANHHENAIDWEDVYWALMPRIYNFFRYRLGDNQIAQDLTATTFEKAWRHREQYRRDRGAFEQWLFTIARNTANDYFRTNHHQEVPLEKVDNLVSDFSVEDESWRNQTFARLHALLATLPAREQELVALKYGSGLNNREIATIIALSESNVGTILHRIIQKLRTEWEKDYEPTI